MESQTPIQIHIPPSLRHLAIPLHTFLSQNPQYTNLAVSSFTFAPSTSSSPSPRLLIVQRAATERGFPNLWEVPGGSCEASDPTILHSLARETFEETELRLTRFCHQVGSGEEFVTGYGAREKRWCKLSFEIKVVDAKGNDVGSAGCAAHGKVAAMGDVGSEGINAVEELKDIKGMNGVSVTLDPDEHQDYAWVTEHEIRANKYAIITEQAKDVMLKAFALRSADVEKSKAMHGSATSATPSMKGSSA